MMRLIITNQMLTMNPGVDRAIHDQMLPLVTDWPGIVSYETWFTDPVFGKYRNLEERQALEIATAEEETDEHMDATAPSETNELAALMEEPFVTEDKEGSNVPGPDMEAEHDSEHGTTATGRPTLPLIDLKVRS